MRNPKVQRMLTLIDKFLSAVDSDSFLTEERKAQLLRFIKGIESDVAANEFGSVETRLHIARNTFLQWRSENPLIAMTQQFGHCSQ